MNKIIPFIISALALISCNSERDLSKLQEGMWRAELAVQDGKLLPFNFKVGANDTIEIYNAEEVIFVDEILYFKDSIRINFPVYEGYIKAKVEPDLLNGHYIKESLDRSVPIKIKYDESHRFLNVKPAKQEVSGTWEMEFTEDDGATFAGKAQFKQQNNRVTGTIRTTTGDYRYLEGVLDGNQLKLSVFDGAHAFLFTADVADDDMLNGAFYSGDHYKAIFKAKRNESFELADENELTFLKEGYDAINFSFPNLQDEMVSLNDARFKDKVVVVQIMGSWCPNCLDESKYYTNYYKKNKTDDIEFIALAFEYAKTKEKAFKSLERLKNKIGIEYPILLAQYGTSDKRKAQEKLPMLNHILSYPTTIFIDKKGKVRKIHTGFNGPATGEKYTAFKNEFEAFLDILKGE